MDNIWNSVERSRIISKRMKEIITEGEDLEEIEEAVEKLEYDVGDFLDDLRDAESYQNILTKQIYEPWLNQINLQAILGRILDDPLENRYIFSQFQFIYERLFEKNPTKLLEHLAEGLQSFYDNQYDDEYFIQQSDGSFPTLKFSKYPQLESIYNLLINSGGIIPENFSNLIS